MGFEEDNQRQRRRVRSAMGMIRNRDWISLRRDIGSKSYRSIEKKVESLSAGRVLEIGCGRGWAIHKLTKDPQIQKYGLDTERFFLDGKRPNLHFVEGDAHHLPFRENMFDVVYSAHTFMYIVDKIRALQEVYRILAPNGLAVIHLWPEDIEINGKPLTLDKQSDAHWTNNWYKESAALMMTKTGKGLGIPGVRYQTTKDSDLRYHYSYASITEYTLVDAVREVA